MLVHGENDFFFFFFASSYRVLWIINALLTVCSVTQNNCRKVWWCFLMISCTFWRSRKNLLNLPKLSCGFKIDGLNHILSAEIQKTLNSNNTLQGPVSQRVTIRRRSSEPSYHPIFGQVFDFEISIISIVDIPLNILWNYQFLIWCNFCVIITFIESCYFILS